MIRKLCLFLIGFCFLNTGFTAIEARQFASPQQEKNYHTLTQELRCPQCQNNNIADSNATIAVDMRDKVFELLQQGYSKQQVVDYMVARYGNFITYAPPLTPATAILWLALLSLILFGILLVWRRNKSFSNSSLLQNQEKNDQLTGEEKQCLQHLLSTSSREKQQ